MKLKMTTLASLLICLAGCNSTSGSSAPDENKPVVDNTTDAGDNNETVDQEDTTGNTDNNTDNNNTDDNDETEAPLVINVNEADPRTPSFVSFDDTTPDDMYWVKVDELSDEFDFWDSNKWVKTNWNYGDTPVNMLNKNSGVDGGNLWIKATLNAESETQWFETSRVRSKSKIKFPMYTESRIKTAHISAYNTFWLNNGDINNRDEIDIIENNSNPSTDYANPDYPWTMHSQYFVVKDGVTERNKGNFDNRNLSESNTLKGVAWNEEYHVVGAWWKDEHNVQFYLNGEPAGKIKTTNPFTLEQHLIWDLWTQDSSWVGGLPAKSDLLDDSINTMKVDWVRTWRLEAK